VALLVLSGKGAKLPRKIMITIYRGMENPQVGIQISSPIQILSKIGFSLFVEG
jgi:hypothetical protein